MSQLLYPFYRKISKYIIQTMIPRPGLICHLNDLFYDRKFTPTPPTYDDPEGMKEFLDMDGGHAYEHLFHDIDHSSKKVYICGSADIDEDIRYGDYNYEVIRSPYFCVLIMSPPLPFIGLPYRATIYDGEWQFEVASDKREIVCSPCNIRVYQALQKFPDCLMIMEMKEILRNSERPVLDEYSPTSYVEPDIIIERKEFT